VNYNAVGEDESDNLQLSECNLCGRKFAIDRLPKHQQACQKAKKGEAKHEKKVAKAQKEQAEKEKWIEKESANKKSNWKAQHEDFINNLKFNKKVKKVEAEGGDIRSLGPAPVAQAPDNLIPCPYCGRRFSQVAGDRHIPSCKNTVNKPKPPPQLRASMGSMGAQQQYQSPNTGGMKATGNNFGGIKAPSAQDKLKAYGNDQTKGSYGIGGGSQAKGNYNTISYDDGGMGKSKGMGGSTISSGMGSKPLAVTGMGKSTAASYGGSPQIKPGMKTMEPPKPQTNTGLRGSTNLSQTKGTQGGGFKLYQNNNSNAYNY